MKTKFIILVLIPFLLLNSCCQQKKCLGLSDINEISLIGFSTEETTQLKLSRYQKNSNFTTLIDSTRYTANDIYQNDSILIAFLKQKFDIAVDYKIEIKDKTYFITAFSSKKIECNSCFPVGHDEVEVLDSYRVNGTKKLSGNLEISISD
jgi:hypothetical protein